MALFAGVLAVIFGAAGCASNRVSAYHQRCLECALRAHADPADVQQAVGYFSRGCEEGDSRSCSILGVMYENGRGVPRDRSQALALYRYACMHGNDESCVNLGRMVERGDGDLAGAVVAYEVACAHRHAAGCFHLGRARRQLAEDAVYPE